MRFVPIIDNVSVLINYEKNLIIAIYINNIIYTAKELQLLNKFETELKEKFEEKLFNKIILMLIILIKRYIKCSILYLSYTYYIWDLLCTYNITDTNCDDTVMIKRSIILSNKGKNAKFDISDY